MSSENRVLFFFSFYYFSCIVALIRNSSLCWIRVVRADILVLFLILVAKHSILKSPLSITFIAFFLETLFMKVEQLPLYLFPSFYSDWEFLTWMGAGVCETIFLHWSKGTWFFFFRLLIRWWHLLVILYWNSLAYIGRLNPTWHFHLCLVSG